MLIGVTVESSSLFASGAALRIIKYFSLEFFAMEGKTEMRN